MYPYRYVWWVGELHARRFGGGDEIQHNLVFSTCRESGDHGPFNSWDRQPFKTTIKNGNPSMIMQWRDISHNFFIDNYSPQEDVDNDDGSCFYQTHHNFLVRCSTVLALRTTYMCMLRNACMHAHACLHTAPPPPPARRATRRTPHAMRTFTWAPNRIGTHIHS